MQVKELSAEGLKRAYEVVVAAAEIEERVDKRLGELKRTIKVPGFRPGKVPVTLLKKQYGRSVMGEVLEQAVNEGSQQAINDNELKPALRPKIEVTSFEDGKDLEFSMELEVLPDVPKVDLKAIELTRLKAEVADEAMQEALDNFSKRFQEYEAPAKARKAEDGDRVTIDFVGKTDGEAFDGGKADDFPLVLGSGSFIPGFEDQLIGAEVDDQVEINVTFPESYGAETLAGKDAVFEVKVKEIAEPKQVELTDDLAKGQGFDDLEALKTAIRESMERDYANASRARVKRALLDHFADNIKFEVPAGMVDLEFDAVWKQIEEELKKDPDQTDKSEDELKAEYKEIAERRVRLGLILSDIGQANELKVEEGELQQAMFEQVRRFPGQEKEVFEYFQKNPQAVEQLRAPIYEDKVVDFVLEMATIEDKVVSVEELMKDPDEQEEAEAKQKTKGKAKSEKE
ncbi:MAG: trigger factor [Alphaproteobacteria bacterium]|nr:trigger factor [Alphaproteobacteria bacterium]